MQRHFELTIKERSGAVLHPSYVGDVDKDFLVDFFDLNGDDVEDYEIKEIRYCCICGKVIEGHGNNAEPLSEGSCCDHCNVTKVIPERMRVLQQQ